ncbi:Vcx1 protein [Martiniozyma asiatica (nom. inval.)]|nr:Vcx1 protein [Martiniozyma asiatica]
MSESLPLIAPTSTDSIWKHTVKTAHTVLLSSKVNLLLLFVPLGIVAGEYGLSSSTVFSLNFFAIVPLASLLAFATEELGESLNNNSLAGLLNATFGNAVEVIVSIIALRQGQVRVVQASMLGSILSNLLLVLGTCFIVGGLKFKVQHFNQTAAQTMGSLLGMAVMGLMLPAAFHLSMNGEDGEGEKLLELSRGTSIVLLIVYCFYMVFQLKTHEYLFSDGDEDNNLSLNGADDLEAIANGSEDFETYAPNGTGPSSPHLRGGDNFIQRPKSIYDVSRNETVHLSPIGALSVLLLSTILVSLCADYLVGSIDGIVESSGLSKTFIGLIVIPIVGNAAEHVTAIYVAYKNKMDLAIGVAIGSSIQIAIFVTPLLVIIGWFMSVDMSLYFSVYETAVIFVSVFITNGLILDGESNWLEGVMLAAVYGVVALSFFLMPDVAN